MLLVTDVMTEAPDARRGCGPCLPVVHIPLSVLLDLINGMRDPSHIETRKLALKTARLGLPSLLQEVSGLCLEETQTKSIDRTLVVSRVARAKSWRFPVNRCCERKAWQGQFGTGAERAGHRHMPSKLLTKATPSRLFCRGRRKDAREKTRQQASQRRFCGKIN